MTAKYSKHQTVIKVSLAVQKVGSDVKNGLVVAGADEAADMSF